MSLKVSNITLILGDGEQKITALSEVSLEIHRYSIPEWFATDPEQL